MISYNWGTRKLGGLETGRHLTKRNRGYSRENRLSSSCISNFNLTAYISLDESKHSDHYKFLITTFSLRRTTRPIQ